MVLGICWVSHLEGFPCRGSAVTVPSNNAAERHSREPPDAPAAGSRWVQHGTTTRGTNNHGFRQLNSITTGGWCPKTLKTQDPHSGTSAATSDHGANDPHAQDQSGLPMAMLRPNPEGKQQETHEVILKS
jgi:hypothetical protein